MNGIQLAPMQQTLQAIQEDPTLKLKKWSVHAAWQTGVKNQVTIREFPPVIMDEPLPLGGTDEGPNPVEMLIGAAASCYAITFELLATQQGITHHEVTAEVEANLNAAVFLGLEEGDGGITDTVITLKAVTSADKAQVEEIANAALGKSPVLASLKNNCRVVLA